MRRSPKRCQAQLFGVAGEVWLQRFSLNDSRPAEFVVLDARGRPAAEVAIPARSRVLELGLDYVVLATKDTDDVEAVSVHRLQRAWGR